MSASISYATMQELHNLYLEGTHKASSAAIGKPDTKTAWFELNDEMRKFLQAVLNEDNRVSGIRVYFIQNPDSQRGTDNAKVPANIEDVSQLSLALVATTPGANGQADIEKDIPPMNHSSLCPSFCV